MWLYVLPEKQELVEPEHHKQHISKVGLHHFDEKFLLDCQENNPKTKKHREAGVNEGEEAKKVERTKPKRKKMLLDSNKKNFFATG